MNYISIYLCLKTHMFLNKLPKACGRHYCFCLRKVKDRNWFIAQQKQQENVNYNIWKDNYKVCYTRYKIKNQHLK